MTRNSSLAAALGPWFAAQITTAHGKAATAKQAWADFLLRLS
ncbi:hypothetical protein AB0J68_07035 [Micromonospora sp. NPDC049580]